MDDDKPFELFLGEREADVSVYRIGDGVGLGTRDDFYALSLTEAMDLAKALIDVAARMDLKAAIEAVLTP